MGLDITLVRITACCSLCASAGKGEEIPGVQIRIKRREERSIYVFLCVFLRAASSSCGVRSRRGTGIPSCLSTENLSAQPVCTSHREARTHFGEKRDHSVDVPVSSAA